MERTNVMYMLGITDEEHIRENTGFIEGVFHKEADALNYIQAMIGCYESDAVFFIKKIFVDTSWGPAEYEMHYFKQDEEGYVIPTTIDSEEFEYAVTLEAII